MHRLRQILDTYPTQLMWGAGAFTLLALVAWWLTFYHARVTILPSPSNAVVAVDGVERPAATRVKLKPGEHTVTVSLGDHIPFEQTIRVKSGLYATLPVTLRAVPHLGFITHDDVADLSLNGPSGFVYYRNRSQQRLERVAVTGDQPANPELLTPAALDRVDEWRWAPGYELGLMRQGERWALYDLRRTDLLNQQVTLWPSGVGSASWHPLLRSSSSGGQAESTDLVHFFAPGDGEETLVKTDPTHTTFDRLTNFRDTDIQNPVVRWVGDGSDVVLRSDQGKLWRFAVHPKTLAAIATDQAVADVTAAPNGQRLVARTETGRLFVIGIDGSGQRELAQTEPLSQVAWSTDSAALWIVGGGGDRTLARVDAASGATTQYTVGSESVGDLTAVAITDDEKKLILAGTRGLATVMIEPTDYPPVNFEK